MEVVELGVEAGLVDEGFVGAGGDDAAFVQDDDEIGHADGGEAVGDEERDAAVRHRSAAGGPGVAFEERVLGGTSRAAVGSSRTMRRGASRIMARPSASFCHWPPERPMPPVK